MKAFLQSPLGKTLLHALKVAVFIGVSAMVTSLLGTLAHDPVLQSFVGSHPVAFGFYSAMNVLLAALVKYQQVS